MLKDTTYDRNAALDYASKWAFGRNPRYMDFHGIGGDCTNFISQCIYAGAKVMNYTETFGWYYISPDNRAPAWSGVPYLFNFLTRSEKSVGPYAREVDVSEIKPADIIQLGDEEGNFYHSLIVLMTGSTPAPWNIYIATHSDDAYMRRLDTYTYANIRYLHIEGVRKYT